ncbi:hypothetical protein POF51_29550 [Brevibacillus sp. AG]|uniref:hypothetical protein n=1 Tax=Brevibacillus sp. AG TaxID=3020891 RepID=UPI00232B6078|nr:hypothetical protein [Brevibacillus sp. AG]MDC0764870.1 hypothetical protein [Brevibacillus sp. AG]
MNDVFQNNDAYPEETELPIPPLTACQDCEGIGVVDSEKCSNCWGTGLVSEGRVGANGMTYFDIASE